MNVQHKEQSNIRSQGEKVREEENLLGPQYTYVRHMGCALITVGNTGEGRMWCEEQHLIFTTEWSFWLLFEREKRNKSVGRMKPNYLILSPMGETQMKLMAPGFSLVPPQSPWPLRK